jgi:hypothetical protein
VALDALCLYTRVHNPLLVPGLVLSQDRAHLPWSPYGFSIGHLVDDRRFDPDHITLTI